MSTTSTPDPGADAPLTRRQRRALERAQQAQQEAQTQDLPALSQPPAQARPAGTQSTSARSVGTPTPARPAHTAPQFQPQVSHHPTVPAQDASRPWRPVTTAPASTASRAGGHGARGTYTAADRGDHADEPAHPEDDAIGGTEDPDPTQRRRTLGGPLGRMPRGPLAVGLIGVVVLAMILVPLAVNKFVSGRNGSGTSTVAQATVLDGNAPLSQLLTISGRVGSGSAPSITLSNEASLSAPSSVLTDVVETGQGREVSEGSPVILQVSQFSGIDGHNTTGNDDGYKLWQGKLGASVGEYINAAVSGQHEGSRIVLREPAEEEDGSQTTKITVVDLLPTTATGEAKQPASGTPTVSEGSDGSITVSSAGLPAPTRASTAVLIKGTGPQIGTQHRLIARTTMVSWSSGQVLGESTYGYQNLPKRIDMSDTLVGISQNLVDITVGSRVVLSLPAEQAQGTEPVVVVIDVLAIDPAKSSASVAEQSGGAPTSTQSAPSSTPTPQDHS